MGKRNTTGNEREVLCDGDGIGHAISGPLSEERIVEMEVGGRACFHVHFPTLSSSEIEGGAYQSFEEWRVENIVGLLKLVSKGDKKALLDLLELLYRIMAARLLPFCKVGHKRMVLMFRRKSRAYPFVGHEDVVDFVPPLNIILVEEDATGVEKPPLLLVNANSIGHAHVGGGDFVSYQMDVAMIVGVNIGDVVVLGVAAEPINPLGFTQEQMATMVDEMGVELNVPLAVVYEAIRQNGLKANNVESVGGKVGSYQRKVVRC
ncbi:hypothetical protein AMTR_s00150p00042480 [Amborella trichopoda]|uniref:Uncharacterized protein n=1 Tax=Amborella trichopoda TaxID=13333 RepID=W1PL83_AMBTC|nr:hypothetical protein AMTR_s00150p00042480 [Amborella trichopoda]